MSARRIWIYRDGRFKRVPIGDFTRWRPGAFSGRGAFESLVLTDGQIWAWAAHGRRLQSALGLLNLSGRLSLRALERIIFQVAERNGWPRARVRVCVWSDEEGDHETVMAQPLCVPSQEAYETGWALGWSSYQRNPGRITHVKTLDYKLFHAAHNEALARGWDESLLRNRRAEVVEASYANVFCVRDGVVMTPPVSSGCLNGITRQIVLRLAMLLGVSQKVTPLFASDICSADEIFVTNSVIGIMPCTWLESRRVGDGFPGRVTRQLQSEYIRRMPAQCPIDDG